mgnify:CR=1 FL=1
MKEIESKLNNWIQEALTTNDTELLMDLGDICHLLAQLSKKINSLDKELLLTKLQDKQ